MKRSIRVSGLAAISLISLANVAQADCVVTSQEVNLSVDDGAVPSTGFVDDVVCSGLNTDPVVARGERASVLFLEGGEISTKGTAITFTGGGVQIGTGGLISSEDGDGVVIEGTEGQSLINISEIHAAGDGLRVSGGVINGDVRHVDVGGNAINLGAENGLDIGSFFVLGTGSAGGHGFLAAGNDNFIIGYNPEATPGVLETGKDSFFAGDNSAVFIGDSGLSIPTGAYTVRATGPDASVINIESGGIIVGFDRADTKVIAQDGPAVRVRGDGFSTAFLGGEIEGTVGVQFDTPSEQLQQVQLVGLLRGTSGVAAQFNDGKNEFYMSSYLGETGFLDGDVRLEGGDDLFAFMDFVQELSGCMSGGGDADGGSGGTSSDCVPTFRDFTFNPDGEFLAEGSVVDGGEGTDTLDMSLLSSMAIVSAILNAPNDLTLTLQWPQTTTTARFLNFENFMFSDRTLTMADFSTVAAVPLPAPALMLGAALAGLGGFARRSGGVTARRG